MSEKVIPEVNSSPPAPTPPDVKDGVKKNRSSKSVQIRKQSQQRERENAKTMDMIAQRSQRYQSTFGMSADDIFGNRILSGSTLPPQKVEVTTDFAAQIVVDTIDILHNSCKIPLPSGLTGEAAKIEDVTTLALATAYQVEAKIHFANQNSKFATILDANQYVTMEQVNNILGRALLPISCFIDQLGYVDVDGQRFHPTPVRDRSLRISDMQHRTHQSNRCFEWLPHLVAANEYIGCFPTGRRSVNGREVLFRPNPNVQLPVDLLGDALNVELYLTLPPNEQLLYGEFVEYHGTAPFPSFPEVCERYIRFLGRVERKLQSTAICDLNLRSGRGCESQLVGQERMSGYQILCRSARKVHDSSFVMSAMLRLGESDTEPLFAEDVCAKQMVVDTTAASVSLSGVLTKRVKRDRE